MNTRFKRLAALVAGIVLAAPGVASAEPDPTPTASVDPLERQRDRFQHGTERYRAGAFGEAILVWSEIYRELGPERGYRVAFSLARAYEKLGDATRAAEHYESYLDELRKRREAGDTVDALLVKQEEQANESIVELRTKLGQIRFRGAEVLVVIDADVPRVGRNVAYVTAGKHAIKFRPSTVDERRVEVVVVAGQVVDVETPAIEAAPMPVSVAPPPAPAIRWETREEPPYPKALVFIGAAATTISLVLPIVLYSNATSYRDEYDLANGKDAEQAQQARQDYAGARSAAYASWAVPALLGTATIALAAYWYFGTRSVRSPMQAGLTF